MKKIKYTNCPVCKNDKLSHFLDCTDHYATQEEYALYKCDHCGFIFTQDHPEESEMGRYYDVASYVSHSDTKKGIVNRIYHEARRWMLKQKHKMVVEQSGKDKGSILDIGCGTGYFLEVMQSNGWDVNGVEISPSARASAQERLGKPLTSNMFDLDNDDKTYDVISLWHVMEHLHDLDRTFDLLDKKLKKGGLLIVALPNADSTDAAHYKDYWGAYDVPRHVWHFTPSTFGLLANNKGYVVENTLPMHLDGFYVSMLSEKYAGHKMSFVRGITFGKWVFVNSLKKKENSSSIIYFLRKNNGA